MLCRVAVLVIAGAVVCALAAAAPAGPLVAGTAPGSGGALTPQYVAGVHYPFGASEPRGYPAMKGSHPVNNTIAYDERPDPARVPGHRAALTVDFCIVASHRRGTPYKAPI